MEDWWKQLSMEEIAQIMSNAVVNGITSLDEIKENAYKNWYISAPTNWNAKQAGQQWIESAKEITDVDRARNENVFKRNSSLFDRQKVAERVPGDNAPLENLRKGTSGRLNAVHHYLHNDDNYVRNRIADYERYVESDQVSPLDRDLYRQNLETLKVHEDAKRLYLGLPQLYGSLEPSPYRPTIGTLENPYQVNALLSDREFEHTILPLWGAWKSGDDWYYYGTPGRVEDLGSTAQLRDIPHLQAAGLSEGYDDKGQYISLYDVWDYNKKIKNANGDNIGKFVGGKPVNIYQRYYLDDWLDIPEEARGNPYIAPSYIEDEYQPYPEHLPDEWQGDAFAKGGKIHIKPENRGKFTALKKRTGHSATWFKQHGTPAQKKMATFALNARKWKHDDGGPLYAFGGAVNLDNYLPSFQGRKYALPIVRY